MKLLQVHDELIFEVPLEEVDQMKLLVRETMEHGVPSFHSDAGKHRDRSIVGRDALKVIGLTGDTARGRAQ